MQAFTGFLRLNIKTFITLLQSLRIEISQTENEATKSSTLPGPSKITTIIRRILPAVRHYSSWLHCSIDIILGYMGPDAPDDLLDLVQTFFLVYANTMTLLATIYDVESLPMIEYLLEEDEDTIEFKPFGEANRDRYFDMNIKTFKEKFHTHGMEKHHPNVEMLGRIRDLVRDSVIIAVKEVSFAILHIQLPSMLIWA